MALLEKARQMNRVIQRTTGRQVSFAEIAESLCTSIGTNVYILGRRGRVWGYAFIDTFHCPIVEDIIKRESRYPDRNNDELLRVGKTVMNIAGKENCVFKRDTRCSIENIFSTIIPILGGGQRLGTLLMSKTDRFLDEDIILAEFGATVIGMEIQRARLERVESMARQKAAVSNAIETLSYSELEAAVHIFNHLSGTDGLLVASKIADQAGITRSVIVNALRKLESAGLIEVRSLGMKGTYIRIVNTFLIEELDRLHSAGELY